MSLCVHILPCDDIRLYSDPRWPVCSTPCRWRAGAEWLIFRSLVFAISLLPLAAMNERASHAVDCYHAPLPTIDGTLANTVGFSRGLSCQRANEPKFAMMEINANKSAPRQPQPRFYWRFRTFTDFSRDAFSPKNAVGAVLRSERRTSTHERTSGRATHAPARRTPAHTSARQRANARANARTCTPVRPHTCAHTRHVRTHTHVTHARGTPASRLGAEREQAALLRALQVQSNRSVCIRVKSGASHASEG